MKLKNAVYPLLASGWSLVIPVAASAQGLVPCSGPNCTVCSFMQLISNVTLFIVRDITAPLAGLLFLVGGIMIVSAGGSEERLKKGKDIFKSTLIGLVIVLASWVLVNTLMTTLGSRVEGFVPGNWWQVQCQQPAASPVINSSANQSEQSELGVPCEMAEGFVWRDGQCVNINQ